MMDPSCSSHFLHLCVLLPGAGHRIICEHGFMRKGECQCSNTSITLCGVLHPDGAALELSLWKPSAKRASKAKGLFDLLSAIFVSVGWGGAFLLRRKVISFSGQHEQDVRPDRADAANRQSRGEGGGLRYVLSHCSVSSPRRSSSRSCSGRAAMFTCGWQGASRTLRPSHDASGAAEPDPLRSPDGRGWKARRLVAMGAVGRELCEGNRVSVAHRTPHLQRIRVCGQILDYSCQLDFAKCRACCKPSVPRTSSLLPCDTRWAGHVAILLQLSKPSAQHVAVYGCGVSSIAPAPAPCLR